MEEGAASCCDHIFNFIAESSSETAFKHIPKRQLRDGESNDDNIIVHATKEDAYDHFFDFLPEDDVHNIRRNLKPRAKRRRRQAKGVEGSRKQIGKLVKPREKRHPVLQHKKPRQNQTAHSAASLEEQQNEAASSAVKKGRDSRDNLADDRDPFRKGEFHASYETYLFMCDDETFSFNSMNRDQPPVVRFPSAAAPTERHLETPRNELKVRKTKHKLQRANNKQNTSERTDLMWEVWWH